MHNISKVEFALGRATGDGYVLRDATRADLDGLMAVERVSQPSPWSSQVFEKEFQLDYSHVWLAEVDGEVVGFLVFWNVYDEVHILNVALLPEHRRRGIARELIRRLIEKAAPEMTSITLEVRVGNVAARRLYEGFGFRVIGQRPRYYADNGEDAAVMALLINDDLLDDG